MKSIYITLSIAITLLLSLTVDADQKPDSIEVRFLENGLTSPSAKIESLAWMEGRWKSKSKPDSFSGGGEHVIFGPHDGQMPGLVRVLNKDKTNMMFELSSFMEADGTLTYRNRHFGNDLVAWQEAKDFVDRRLVAIEGKAAYFHGITFVNRSPSKMGVSFVLTDDDGKRSKYNVDYTKVPLK